MYMGEKLTDLREVERSRERDSVVGETTPDRRVGQFPDSRKGAFKSRERVGKMEGNGNEGKDRIVTLLRMIATGPVLFCFWRLLLQIKININNNLIFGFFQIQI